jgi:hypothetical protein
MRVKVALLALFASAIGGAATAQSTMTVKELLAAGFEIKTGTVVTQDVLQRAINPGWRDGYLLVLQKGTQVALCHTVLGDTNSADTLVNSVCSVSSAN